MTNGEWLYIFCMEGAIQDIREEESKKSAISNCNTSPTYKVRKQQNK